MVKKNNTHTNRSQYGNAFDRYHAWTYDLHMNELIENIKREMKTRNITEPQLAERSGISQASIWRILHAGQDPRSITVKKIAKALGISELELHKVRVSKNSQKKPDEEYWPIRMGGFHLEAGVTGFTIEYLNEDKPPIFFRKDWFVEHHYNPERLIACPIKGDSMEPKLFSGDIVIINLDNVKPVDGKVYAVNYEGELVIKRLIRDGQQWFLQSDNPDKTRFPNKLCSGDFCIILGLAVHMQSSEI
jgi:phage repressor protein C with HTH and peptisase S24 domain